MDDAEAIGTAEPLEPARETPGGGSDARRFIEWWARRKMRGFEGTIDDHGDYLAKIYPTAKSISEQVAADYHGRFLIELIQNAHDVHPADRADGEIEICLDAGPEGHPTLYVANGGTPFGRGNVEALSDLGLSSKPPGQSIGNKGLGFRSVRHVCDSPEIYSQAPAGYDAGRFAGFCFRFADDNDLAALASKPRALELARRDLPHFHVPVWLDEQPDLVRGFAAHGFATVIALPLRDERAAQAVHEEIYALVKMTVPMLLFLSRLARLNVRVRGIDGAESHLLSLTRTEKAVQGAPPHLTLADLGPAGRFLLTRRSVEEEKMIEAIIAGIEQTQLHSNWREWRGPGEVALAVRLDEAAPTASRLFTYLPMGEQAHAPFSGYLHASFFPTANRKGLDGKIRLNAMLLEHAADLAAETAVWAASAAREPSGDLTPRDRARAAVDLMCWQKTQSFDTTADLPARVAAGIAAAAGVAEFGDAPMAPVLVTTGSGKLAIGWAALRDARRWTHEGRAFSITAAVKHSQTIGAWLLWPGLGSRLDALVAYAKARMPTYFDSLSADERTMLAVESAGALAKARGRFPEAWTDYYKELAGFVGTAGGSLADKHVLLGDDGTLQPAMSVAEPAESADGTARKRVRRAGRVSVFAPPVRRGPEGEQDDLSPPKALADNFAFLSDALDWHGELAEARGFLVRHRLVFEFDREGILTQLARVLRRDERNVSRAAGLRWAFQIWRRPQGQGRSISLPANLRLYVPTLDHGFVAAEEAIFSDGWPEETRGRLLQRFLVAAPRDCPELDQMARRRLAGPHHYAFRGGANGQWLDFLTELGVKRGLQPRRKALSGGHRGDTLSGTRFWVEQGMPETVVAPWKAVVAAAKPHGLGGASAYTVTGELRWFPGQGDIGRFDRDALELYAMLVIAWLGDPLPDSWLTIRHTFFSQSDVREWPTPLAAFLRTAAWIPATEPTRESHETVTVAPSDIWMVADAGDRFPSFLRRPAVAVLRALERAAAAHLDAIRARTGLRTFDQPDTLLAQAAFLADQFAKPGFDGYFERQLANLYADTWQRIADRHRTGPPLPAAEAPPRLLARRRGALECFVMKGADAGGEPVYVRNTDDEAAASLVEAAGRPMIETRGGSRTQLGDLLRGLYVDRVRLLSEVDYQVTIDGEDVGTGEATPLVHWCPRLPLMAAVAMEAVKGLEARNVPVNRRIILDRLDSLSVRTGTRLGFRLDGIADDLAGGPDALSLKLADGRPVIAVRLDDGPGWAQLDRALAAVCDGLLQPGLEQGLRILLRSLQAASAAMSDPLDTDRDLDALCESLRLSGRARRAARETLGAGIERHVPWLRALLSMGGGQPALDAFASVEHEAVKDPVFLREAISPWLEPLGCDAQTVLGACRTALSVAELREALCLEFEALNLALLSTGQMPDTYPEAHARQLASRIKAASIEIADALRAVFAPTLAAGEPAPAYAQTRDAAADLEPDPAWLTRWQEVPDEILTQRIDAWLAEQGAQPLGEPHPDLAPLEEVRRANGQTLKAVIGSAGPLVRAWCGARSRAIPAQWAVADGGMADFRTTLDRVGAYDFKALDRDGLLAWIRRLGAWPEGMELTLDSAALELGDAALAAAQAEAKADAAARRKQERSIEFNGVARDPEETDWTALDSELSKNLSTAFLDTPVGREADLAPARARPAVTPQSGGWGSGTRNVYGSRTFAPSSKTDMIGRLGELAVRRWLQKRLPKQDIDDAWKSSNAKPFTGKEGNDGLGYDFEIGWQRQIWQIEVKSHLGDPRAFELGETQVRAGRAAARTRSGLRYWIAYVSNVANARRIRVEMIPNPMSEAGEAVLELLGEGLRYGFRRS